MFMKIHNPNQHWCAFWLVLSPFLFYTITIELCWSSIIDKDRLYSVMEQKCAIVSIFNSYMIIWSFGKDNTAFCHKAVDKLHYTNDRKRSYYDIDMISRNFHKLQLIYA